MTPGRGRDRGRLRSLALAPLLAGVARLAAALLVVAPSVGRAQGAPAPDLNRRVELFADRHQVSGGFGDWEGVGTRLSLPVGARDTWLAEALHRRAFGDAGTYLSLANQHVWTDRWYTYIAIAGGSGGYVLPDLRADASLSYKWGARQALVSTVGATLVDGKLGYRDAGGFAALTAYLSPVAVAEAGVRLTRSTPGDVDAARGNGALTLGRQGTSVVVLRGSSGREGYQLLGPGAAVRRFTSHEGAVSWRQWLGPFGGAFLQGEHYRNPYYRRTGVTIGVFAHW
ncbi:MAG: hypothetical protein ABS52_01200 [Gemmatimonadetes bacterium SCN 70-22]|nr:MAG: hypothetical protein ABS52_01200 [Gemmatimonadetes bacterium SCN 70-22]